MQFWIQCPSDPLRFFFFFLNLTLYFAKSHTEIEHLFWKVTYTSILFQLTERKKITLSEMILILLSYKYARDAGLYKHK